jgi:uncharacterized protein YlxP (DUF503 family)
MVIGVCRMELYLPDRHSLKDKRQVIKSLKDRMRQHFNVSVAEVDAHDLWQRAVLAAACVGTDRAYVNGVLDQLVRSVEREHAVQLVRTELEFV